HSSIPLQLRFRVLEQDGKVESSLWGSTPKPWQVKVESQIIDQIHLPDPQYLSGWVVQTSRYIKHELEPSSVWQLDYQAMSHYQPYFKT
ncbi:MAG: hypothetical protein ACK47G_12995, partial [Pseudanabaena sp.]